MYESILGKIIHSPFTMIRGSLFEEHFSRNEANAPFIP